MPFTDILRRDMTEVIFDVSTRANPQNIQAARCRTPFILQGGGLGKVILGPRLRDTEAMSFQHQQLNVLSIPEKSAPVSDSVACELSR